MELRDAERSDFATVRKLLETCDLYSEDLTGSAGHRFVLAWKVNTLIGTVGLEIFEEVALLRSLAVEPNYRQRGIASELVRKIESVAVKNNVRTLYLLTLTAENFFAKLGYGRTDRELAPAALQGTTEFRSVCPASAVCMTKRL